MDAQAVLTNMLQAALSGRYTVERELGRGGMATVFLARDVRHGRAVAVKVLERDVVAPSGAERFLHEIQFAARLTHPHVLGVHDSGEADGLLYYVMPYVEGETLRARMTREGPLPLVDARRLLRELADALAYAHARGVVHRDLKPENVLLSGGHAVVADFGIAKAVAAATSDGTTQGVALTGTGVSIGTPGYMAPEQAVGDARTDHRADLYALGVVAYEVLAGAHPFGARTPQALVVAHLTETPAPLLGKRPGITSGLGELVMRLLAKDPDLQRPQSADEVVRALDGMAELPTPMPRRSRAIALATAAVVVVALAVGGYLWRRSVATAVAQGPVAIHTVAVLPFVNTSGNAADDYFSDGMTDELAHALARLPGLRVAGRTSSYTFKGKSATAQDVGRTLDVAAIVSGTVRRAGDRLRVATQLVSTADGKMVWDSVYESASSDVFAVQDEFTRAIATALAPSLGNRPAAARVVDVRRGTKDEEAYELYLQGRHFYFARDAGNVVRSISFFRQAIARDPRFARAHAALALAYASSTTYLPDPLDTMPPLSSASAQRAVQLDSTLDDVQLALGTSMEDHLRFGDAERHFRAVIAADPSNAPAHHELGFVLLALGNTDGAIREFREAVRLDPLVKSSGTALELALVYARRFPEADTAAQRVMRLDSTFALYNPSPVARGSLTGHADSAVRTLERGAALLHPTRRRCQEVSAVRPCRCGQVGRRPTSPR